jgi:hypothetical protein
MKELMKVKTLPLKGMYRKSIEKLIKIHVELIKVYLPTEGQLEKAKEVLQKESGRRLCYIYSCCTYMELFQ